MAKTLTIKEKILSFLKEKGIKKVEFFEKTGIQASNFKGANLTSSPGSDMLVKILTEYPELSPEWLLLGKGDMLKTNGISSTSISNDETKSNRKIMMRDQEKKDDTGLEVYHKNNIETRPRIPYDAAAGALSVALTGVSIENCEPVPIIPTLPDYDFTIIARGDSMLPEFHSGDELACSLVSESSFIQWGRPHVLDTAQGIVVKRIFNLPTTILCRSVNSDYPDFEIPKEEIYHLAMVVGVVRHY